MTSTPAKEWSRASTLSTFQPQPPANLSKEDAAEWWKIERALGHIQSIAPSHPYVLTIPHETDVRYRHSHPYQAQQWLHRTPFNEREHEAGQYLTWRFHEPDGMYVLHSTRPREEREDASSRVSTPKVGSGGAKKAMSLGAYKKKVAGATPGPEENKKAEVNGVKQQSGEERKKEGEKTVKKPAVKGPIERVKADDEVLAAVEDGESIVPKTAEKKKQEGKNDLKRKREEEQKEEGREAKRQREDSKAAEERKKKADNEPEPKAATNKQEVLPKPPSETAEPLATQDKRKSPTGATGTEELTAKKAKLSSPRDIASEPKSEAKAAEQAGSPAKQVKSPIKAPQSPPKRLEEVNDTALPPRLSPLRVEESRSVDEDTSLLLPPRLSPTLPTNITASLDARKHQRSTSKSSAASGKLSPPHKASENDMLKKKSPRNGFRATSSSPIVRSDAEDGRGRTKAAVQQVRSLSSSGKESDAAVAKTNGVAKKESKAKLIVKLKFKQRSVRESLRQLLRLPAAKKKPETKPSPALPATDARHREQRDVKAKGVAQKIGPATKGVARKVEKSATSTPNLSEKRAREEDDEKGPAVKKKKADIAVYEPPGKRRKSQQQLSPDLQKSAAPTTPAQPPHPAKQQDTPVSSAQKPPTQPPIQPTASSTADKKSSKELLAAATTSGTIKPEMSNDSATQVPTPSDTTSSPAASSASHTQTNLVPKSTPTATTSTPSQNQTTKTPRQQAWESTRLTLDALGRDLKRAATASSNQQPPTSHTRSTTALQALESLLVFILSFTASDEASLAASPRQPPRTGPWRTLQSYFPFVKKLTEGFPALHGVAAGLGVVFCARVLEVVVEEGRVGDAASGEVVGGAWGMLQRCAGDAEAKLDATVLRTAFPEAWKGSATGEFVEEKLEPGKFAGPYKLPLGVQTKPVRAVRAAHAMLGEWIKKEGLDYELRLKLE